MRRNGPGQSFAGNRAPSSAKPACGGVVATVVPPLASKPSVPGLPPMLLLRVWRSFLAFLGSSLSAIRRTKRSGWPRSPTSTSKTLGRGFLSFVLGQIRRQAPGCFFSVLSAMPAIWLSKAVFPAPGAPWISRVVPASGRPDRKPANTSAPTCSMSRICSSRPTKKRARLRSPSRTKVRNPSRSGLPINPVAFMPENYHRLAEGQTWQFRRLAISISPVGHSSPRHFGKNGQCLCCGRHFPRRIPHETVNTRLVGRPGTLARSGTIARSGETVLLDDWPNRAGPLSALLPRHAASGLPGLIDTDLCTIVEDVQQQ